MTPTEIANAILELIDSADGFTRSDLQGVVDALSLRILHDQVPATKDELHEICDLIDDAALGCPCGEYETSSAYEARLKALSTKIRGFLKQ